MSCQYLRTYVHTYFAIERIVTLYMYIPFQLGKMLNTGACQTATHKKHEQLASVDPQVKYGSF